MKQIALTLGLTFTAHQTFLLIVAAQAESIPPALAEMAEAERAFVRRAQEVSVSQAFIEWFAPDAVDFQSGTPASAQIELRKRPQSARDPKVIFWWEPRYGDIAASGELGYLTGPVRMGHTDKSDVRHGNYASIWKRQADGTFKVVIDIGVDPPGEVPFKPGFTRAPFAGRYAGTQIGPLAEASLLAADRAFNAAARTSLAVAYEQTAAPNVRLHRNSHLPFETREVAIAWLKTQPALTIAETMYVESAKSADLGYTWGSYETMAASDGKPRGGHYARVWVRDAGAMWRLVLDLDAPRRP
jgi:ketosteroid isomerase-like protein